MPGRERVQKKTSKREQDEVEVEESTEKKVDSETLAAEMDDILDEIDEVLEENAQEFVKGYVQKGGE